MSLLCKIHSHDRLLIKNGFLSISAKYSRRMKSEPLESYYKNVSNPKAKDGVQEIDGGPNWEIFNPKGNRFYLPNALGPVWTCKNSIFSPLNVNLEELIDFSSKDPDKFQLSCNVCPVLIRDNVFQKFPVSVAHAKGLASELRVITLSYNKHTEAEEGAKKFVIAARNICKRLRVRGHWADFINPFSGKAFHNYDIMNEINQRYQELGMKYEDQNNCVIISSVVDGTFSGSIFTDAPYSNYQLKKILRNGVSADFEHMMDNMTANYSKS